MWPVGCWRPEGGRPPLAEGWGIGDGEFAGEGTRALPPGMGMGAELPDWGVLCAMAGESKPN